MKKQAAEFNYTASELQKVNPQAEYGVQIKIRESNGETKWLRLDEQKAELVVAWITEHFLQDKLSDKLFTLMTDAIKTCGSYDPTEVMSRIEEQLTFDEFDICNNFLEWVHSDVMNRAFGHGNYQQRFKEYKNSLK